MSPQLAIICVEALIVLVSLIWSFRGRKWMFGFAIGFGIYLYYALASMYAGVSFWHNSVMFNTIYMPFILLVASIGILYSVWEARR